MAIKPKLAMLLAGESSEQVQRLVMVDLPGILPFQALARSLVERIVHLLHLPIVDIVEAFALRKPAPEKAVGVLIGPSLRDGGDGRSIREPPAPPGAPSASKNSLPLSSVTVSTTSPASTFFVASLTSALAFLAALPPTRYLLRRSTWVIRQVPSCHGIALPVADPSPAESLF